jgi:hypothetical protein
VIASEEAAALVSARGGRLYVWAAGGHCCGGTKHLETSTTPQPGRPFERVFDGEFELHFPAEARLPGELHLDARRGRVRAYWDGCAWVT